MEQRGPDRKLSRRDFLKTVQLGFAGAIALSLGSKLLPSERTLPTFPEDSIFAPDKRRYGRQSRGTLDQEAGL